MSNMIQACEGTFEYAAKVKPEDNGINAYVLSLAKKEVSEERQAKRLTFFMALWIKSFGKDLDLVSRFIRIPIGREELVARALEEKTSKWKTILVLNEHIEGLEVDWERLLQFCKDLELVVTLEQELEESYSSTPASFLWDVKNIMVARTDEAAVVLRRCGYSGFYYGGETRQILAPDPAKLWEKVCVFEGRKVVSLSQQEKMRKYVKSLFAPMASIVEVNVTKDDCIIVPDVTRIPEEAIDGQVLIAWSLWIKLVNSPDARLSFKLKAKGPARKQLCRTFIGRMHVPGFGLIKGGFVVVPDNLLNFGGRQYAVAASEVKTGLQVRHSKAILCASSGLKKMKEASTDLQNILMSTDIKDPRLVTLLSNITDHHRTRHQDSVTKWIEELEVASLETEETEESLSELALAKALVKSGFDVRSIPRLYVDLMNLSGDSQFDPDRFRTCGSTAEGTWRISLYLQAHPGRSILALEEKLGPLDIKDEGRAFLESWKDMELNQIMTNDTVYEMSTNGQTYVTRRPMTLTGGMPMTLTVNPFLNKLSPVGFLKPVRGMTDYMQSWDGADYDDSFELNFGLFDLIARDWHTKKADFFTEEGDALERLNDLMGETKVFGMTLDDWEFWAHQRKVAREAWESVASSSYGEAATRWQLTSSGKPKAVPYLRSLVEVREKLKVDACTDFLESWGCPSVLSSTVASWTGSAANAQMFATFVLQDMVLPGNEEAKEIAKIMTSVMLSDVVDAQTQGKNVDVAAQVMFVLALGTMCLAQLLTEQDSVTMPLVARKRAMWYVKNLITEGYTDKVTWKRAAWRFIPVKEVKPAALEVEITPWDSYTLLDEYLDWYKGHIANDIGYGLESNEREELALRVAQERGKVNVSTQMMLKGIVTAQILSAKRSREVSSVGMDTNDDNLRTWINAPYKKVVGEIPETMVKDISLSAISSWNKIDKSKVELGLNEETMKFFVKNAGNNLAYTGAMTEETVSWLSTQNKREEEEVELTYFNATREDHGRHKIIEYVDSRIPGSEIDLGVTVLGDLGALGFTMAYKGSQSETPFTAIVNRNRKVLDNMQDWVINHIRYEEDSKLNWTAIVSVTRKVR